MVYGGNKTSTTVGTPVRLASVQTICAWVTIMPRSDASGVPANAGPVVVGGKSVTFQTGLVLQVGDSGVVWNIGDVNWIDLAEVWMDVLNSGDGVQFIYGTR